MDTGRRIRRAALTAVVALASGVSPLVGLHPGHDHAGILGGTFHMLLPWIAVPVLLTSIALALFSRRRDPR